MALSAAATPHVATGTPPADAGSVLPANLRRARPLFDRAIVLQAARDAARKLSPLTLWKNPVIFVVEVGATLTTVLVARDLIAGAPTRAFGLQIAIWLWFTVVFATFAEAMAEARGKAQADSLRRTKTEVTAKRLDLKGVVARVPGSSLRTGDLVLCEALDIIPGDGEVVEGVASVDESVITGESAPVIRESGGDRSAVTGGTRVLSDWIRVRITSNPGETFLDRMIALVEGAKRQKTPNEVALNILIAGLTLIFLLAVATLAPYAGTPSPRPAAGPFPRWPCLSRSSCA
jgi:potassium-transporting ATPase ATP-binding subunit